MKINNHVEPFQLQNSHCVDVKRILIIDDSKLLLDFLLTTFTDTFDFPCDGATSEAEAKEKMNKHQYDLIIVDIYLPDSTGDFIASLIRKEENIIVITASEDEASRQKCSSLNIVDYVVKCENNALSRYLIKAVRRFINNKDFIVAICDDSSLARRSMASIVAHENLSYIEMVDGSEVYDYVHDLGQKVDVVVTDYNMPNMDGLELIRKLRNTYGENELAILSLSASSEGSLVAKFLKAGANDFISKPYSREEFLTRLNNTLENLFLHRQNKIMIEHFKKESSEDYLTQLYNRKYFFDYIAKKMQASATRSKHEFGILMLDIDHFKDVNDNYGHDAGDKALQGISEILRGSARSNDYLFRWGADEFLIFVPQAEQKSLSEFAERIRVRIEQSMIKLDDFKEINLTVSIGLALGLENIESVIKVADLMLYHAKGSGCNCVKSIEDMEEVKV